MKGFFKPGARLGVFVPFVKVFQRNWALVGGFFEALGSPGRFCSLGQGFSKELGS